MRNLYVDANTYDLVVLERNLRFTVNTTEWLAAKIESRLRTFFGEWFINQEIGVPYFEQILKKQVDINNVQALLSSVVKNTNGVKELLSFNVIFDNSLRVYTYTFEVLADTDDTVTGEGSL